MWCIIFPSPTHEKAQPPICAVKRKKNLHKIKRCCIDKQRERPKHENVDDQISHRGSVWMCQIVFLPQPSPIEPVIYNRFQEGKKKSPGKALFRFFSSFSFSSDSNMWSFAHTSFDSIPPLNTIYFCLRYQKKRRRKKNCIRNFSPSLVDYTNSNLFNFSLLFFFSFPLSHSSSSIENEEHIPHPSLHDIKAKECDGSRTGVWGWFGYNGAY